MKRLLLLLCSLIMLTNCASANLCPPTRMEVVNPNLPLLIGQDYSGDEDVCVGIWGAGDVWNDWGCLKLDELRRIIATRHKT